MSCWWVPAQSPAYFRPWEPAYGRVREAVSLAAPDGRRVPEFLLHIQDESAWWRWSDEPFLM